MTLAQHRRSSRGTVAQPRGFVLLLVLVALAVVATLVAGQMHMTQADSFAAIEKRHEAQARAAAETCIEQMLVYSDQFMRNMAVNTDFDLLLDPDGVAANADDHGSGVSDPTVFVPRGSTAVANRYSLRRLPGTTTACLIRFDDNSDDTLLALPLTTGNHTVAEGAGVEVPHRDRDKAVLLTVIGVSPASAAADADVYTRAKARVTLKRMIAAARAPAIWAGGSVEFKEGIAICGPGGLQGASLANYDGTPVDETCICGDTMFAGAAAPPNCVDPNNSDQAGACNTAATCDSGEFASAVPPTPTVITPPLNSWLANEGFHNGGSGAANLGTNNRCEVLLRDVDAVQEDPAFPAVAYGTGTAADLSTYYTDSAQAVVFAWDHTDNAPGITLPDLGDGLLDGVPGGGAAVGCLDSAGAGIACPAFNCASSVDDPVKRPCQWKRLAPGVWSVRCRPQETPCWKAIAILNGASDVLDLRLNHGEQECAGDGGPYFCPGVTGAKQFLPNFKQNVSWTTPGFCSAAGGNCTSCAGGVPTWGIKSGRWHGDHSDLCADEIPKGIIVAFDHVESAGERVDWHNGVGEPTGACAAIGLSPVNMTVLARHHIELKEGGALCCANCNCNWSFAGGTAPACTAAALPMATGFVLRAGGDCLIKENTYLIGKLGCRSVHIKESSAAPDCTVNGKCIIGDVIGYETIPEGSVAVSSQCEVDSEGSVDCRQPGVCVKENTCVIGNILSKGDVCIKESMTMIGSILAEGDLAIKEGVNLTGQIIVEGKVAIKEDTVITGDPSSTFGALPRSEAWFEQMW